MTHGFPLELPEHALGGASDDTPDIPFTPVERLRRRRTGWSGDRQRAFIATLARCGSVAAAARSVGMTARSAYRLCDAPTGNGLTRARVGSATFGTFRWQPLRSQAAKRP
jgi:hypothetical protein